MKKLYAILTLGFVLTACGKASGDGTPADGTLDTTFISNLGTGFNGSVNAIVIQNDGKIVVGGNFTTVNGNAALNIARLNSDGSFDSAFTSLVPNLGGPVYALAKFSDGRIIVGGSFSGACASFTYNNLVAIDPTTGCAISNFVNSLSPSGVNGVVRGMAVDSSDNVYITGDFTSVSGSAAVRLAKIKNDGTLQSDLNTTTSVGKFGLGSVGLAVNWANNLLTVGGNFSSIGAGTAQQKTFQINTSSSTLNSTFNIGNSGFDNPVYALAAGPSNSVYAGGNFTSYKSQSVSRFVRLSSNGTLDTAFGAPGFNNDVFAVLVQSDGNIVVAGSFTVVGSKTTGRLTRLTSLGAFDTFFKSFDQAGLNATAQALAVDSSQYLYVGGDFTSYNGTSVAHLIRLK